MNATTIRNRFTRRHCLTLALGIALLLAPLELGGCTGGAEARHVYIGVDTSGSARRQMGAFRGAAYAVTQGLTVDRDRLTAYRVGHEVREFTGGDTWNGDGEAFARTLVAETQPIAEPRGTLPEMFWRTVAKSASSSTDSTVSILLLSDGANDDLRPESWAAIQDAAERLAENQNLRAVVVAGAQPENWARLRKAFEPLGDRFHLLPPTQCQPEAVNRLLTAP